MKKRILAMFLSVMLLSAIVVIPAHALSPSSSGSYKGYRYSGSASIGHDFGMATTQCNNVVLLRAVAEFHYGYGSERDKYVKHEEANSSTFVYATAVAKEAVQENIVPKYTYGEHYVCPEGNWQKLTTKANA